MTLQQIKEAVKNGLTVNWKAPNYVVIESKGDYLIKCTTNNSCISLTWADGETLNAKEEDFYINQ